MVGIQCKESLCKGIKERGHAWIVLVPKHILPPPILANVSSCCETRRIRAKPGEMMDEEEGLEEEKEDLGAETCVEIYSSISPTSLPDGLECLFSRRCAYAGALGMGRRWICLDKIGWLS